MPSFCSVNSCKLVKQVGDDRSYHKFPFNNREVFQKWVDFVAQSGPNSSKHSKSKKISKYSSICSRHFLPSDFVEARLSRRFLKKSAVPSVYDEAKPKTGLSKEDQDDCETVEVETSDPLSTDVCSLCQSLARINQMNDVFFSLIRKCLPITLSIDLLQKICDDCVKNLRLFSSFIDKVAITHSLPEKIDGTSNAEVNIQRHIKIEPITSIETEEKRPSIQVINFAAQQPSFNHPSLIANPFTPCFPQKKCEILEIIDIKPFHYEPMQQEPYDNEDDIQILSPKQLKVELDPDEDGSNELELIRNYMYISTVFLQDHNYTKCSTLEGVEQNVKTENDDENLEATSEDRSQHSAILRICNICNSTFRTFRKYLVHKICVHQSKSTNNRRKKSTYCEKVKKIREICAKIIKRKKRKVQIARNSKKLKEKKKSHVCPVCLKVFSGSKNLYQHSISHSNFFYSCSLCSKKFKRSHGLKQHFKSIHEKEKDHVCPVCEHPYLLKADMIKCRHSKLKKLL